MKKALLLNIILLVFCAHSLLGQQYFTRNYTINEGLPDNCIHDIFKDSRGFLWIGTNAGLAKFDGGNFQIYSSLNGLAGDQISSITEDNQGNIWIGCRDGGVSIFNGEKIESFNSESGIISNEVSKLYFSKKYSILFIGTENGLSIFENGIFNSFQEKTNGVAKRLQITGFLEREDHILIFTNGNGLYKYVPDLKNIIRIPSNNPLNYNSVNSIFISETNDTLINYNRTSIKTFNNKECASCKKIGFIKEYVEDSENNIWIAAWNNNYFKTGGLYKYHDNKIEKFNKLVGIDTENIYSLEFDNAENILWIGTKENGLYLFPQTNYTYFKAQDFNLDDLNIKDLYYEESGILWILTENNVIKRLSDGTYKIIDFQIFEKPFNKFKKNSIKRKYGYLNDKSGSYEKYKELKQSGKYSYPNPYQKYDEGKSNIISAGSLYKPLKYDVYINKELSEFNSICKDQNDNIWIGSNTGIFKIDDKDKIKYFDIDGIYCSDFAFDANNKLHAVSWEDLIIYQNIEKNSNFTRLSFYDSENQLNIRKIKTKNNKLWFLNNKGGQITTNKNGKITSYKSQLKESFSYNDICVDNFGKLLKGGNNGNIYISSLLGDSLINNYEINTNNGLTGFSIKWLCCTPENIVIAGTNSGLNIINLNDLYNRGIPTIRTIDKSNGFIDYTGKVSILGDDNELWIGTDNNLIKVDLQKVLQSKSRNIDFYIKSIEVNDSPLKLKEYHDVNIWTQVPSTSFKLPFKKNSITFNFDIIRYLDHEKINFSYILEGYNDIWSKETKDKRIVFQNLRPGTYRLRIKAFEKSYSDNNQELSIAFKISPPLWLRWWFISFFVLIISFSILFFHRLRIKSVTKKERQRTEIAERISEFEMKALRAQMNPHFIFNAINSIQNYMLDNDVDAALSYLSDFAKLIRITLDNVSKKRITLEDELEYLKYYLSLEQMRFDKKFETEIILPRDSENLKILIPPMIIQPYIENSIKHGFSNINKGGKIKIKFSISDDNILKCIVEDNGIGREKSRDLNKNNKSHKSKSTFITKERLALLNQTMIKKGFKTNTIDLYDDSNVPCGTRVEINMPI
jgi:ligand-binding sensor domain-containing protein